jgi:dihydropteridine reductase
MSLPLYNNVGLFVTIGATAALSSTPGMMGYGLSKAAAHHMTLTLGATTGKSLESPTVQKDGRRYRQYAANLDTDYTTWTKPLHIAKEIGNWVKTPQLRPHSGALVKVSTNAQGSTFDLVR